MTRFIAVLLVGVLDWSCACIGKACRLKDANEADYLIFWGPYPGDAPDQFDRIGPLAARLGTTGDGKRRQLGFSPGIPFWLGQEAVVNQALRRAFDTAKKTNVAVDFLIDVTSDGTKGPISGTGTIRRSPATTPTTGRTWSGTTGRAGPTSGGTLLPRGRRRHLRTCATIAR